MKATDASALLAVPVINQSMAKKEEDIGYRTAPLTADEELAVFDRLAVSLVKHKIIKKDDKLPLSAWLIVAEVIKASGAKWKSAKREGISNGAFGRDIKKALEEHGWVFGGDVQYWHICQPLIDIGFLATDGFGRMSKYCLPEFKKPATKVSTVQHAVSDAGYKAYLAAQQKGQK